MALSMCHVHVRYSRLLGWAGLGLAGLFSHSSVCYSDGGGGREGGKERGGEGGLWGVLVVGCRMDGLIDCFD